MTFIDGHPQYFLETTIAMIAAYLLALPLGWERKAHGVASIGWRTIPLVSVGTCAYLLLSRYLYDSGIYDAGGMARVLRAMMTGIGFIGGGAILKRGSKRNSLAGLTTAADVWMAGAIGASIAHGHYLLATLVSAGALIIIGVAEVLTLRESETIVGEHAEARSVRPGERT